MSADPNRGPEGRARNRGGGGRGRAHRRNPAGRFFRVLSLGTRTKVARPMTIAIPAAGCRIPSDRDAPRLGSWSTTAPGWIHPPPTSQHPAGYWPSGPILTTPSSGQPRPWPSGLTARSPHQRSSSLPTAPRDPGIRSCFPHRVGADPGRGAERERPMRWGWPTRSTSGYVDGELEYSMALRAEVCAWIRRTASRCPALPRPVATVHASPRPPGDRLGGRRRGRGCPRPPLLPRAD